MSGYRSRHTLWGVIGEDGMAESRSVPNIRRGLSGLQRAAADFRARESCSRVPARHLDDAMEALDKHPGCSCAPELRRVRINWTTIPEPSRDPQNLRSPRLARLPRRQSLSAEVRAAMPRSHVIDPSQNPSITPPSYATVRLRTPYLSDEIKAHRHVRRAAPACAPNRASNRRKTSCFSSRSELIRIGPTLARVAQTHAKRPTS